MHTPEIDIRPMYTCKLYWRLGYGKFIPVNSIFGILTLSINFTCMHVIILIRNEHMRNKYLCGSELNGDVTNIK